MQTRTIRRSSYAGLASLLVLTTFSYPVQAANALQDALINNGDIYADFRYRYEHVDDDLAPNDANANTIRSVIGYQSGEYYGFSVLLEGEQISRLGGDFREFPGSQSNANHAIVADPDGTELNQGYLQYRAAGNNRLRAGRQIITYREAPFHRFIGTVLWRQNWQTFDAVSLENTMFADTKLSYAYIWNVNRIFGENAPSALSNFDSDSHLVNFQYDRFDIANVETYAYLLDFDNAPAVSTATYGVRLSGEYGLSSSLTPVYALEYAYQEDYGDNPSSYDVSYQLVQGGLKFKPAALLDSLVLKGNFERLSGTGNVAFQTPLGTNHAFQGTADRFLSTPRDGIRDTYGTLVATMHGFKFIAGYHRLESDKFDYDYGDELDLQLTRGFGQHFTVGAKYANYDADTNATNLARNGVSTVSADAQKFWLFMMASF